MRTTVSVGSRGRIVVPVPVRDELGVEAGDVVEIDVRPVYEGGGSNG